MVIVKCKECGNEYEIEDDENPLNYQCECGGDFYFDGEDYYEGEKGFIEEISVLSKDIVTNTAGTVKDATKSISNAMQKEYKKEMGKIHAQEKAEREKKGIDDNQLVTCPACEHKISIKAPICPNCGRPTGAKKVSRTPELVLGIWVAFLDY
ncbi:hypothetical protein MBMB1_0481 [Methanobacterium sp. MB1]|nr:hypothetical protein MBMB1_0481 [Methanobacterium sp. MB1]